MITSSQRAEMYDPTAFTDEDVEEYSQWVARPGGWRSILEIYRQSETDAEQNQPLIKTKLPMPVLAVGGKYFFAEEE